MHMLSTQDIQEIKTFYNSGTTKQYAFRKQQLEQLRTAIQKNEASLMEALYLDLHKPAGEAYSTEIGFLYAEISFTLSHLKEWMKPVNVHTPAALMPSASKLIKDPAGIVLIIAPWNYPVQLLLGPLVAAIAGGNCAVLKPTEFTPHTTEVLKKLIEENFDANYIRIIEGDGAVVVPTILEANRFDHIFFTGSILVGKAIAKMAAEKLTPVTLELGGKSPCIVDKDADLITAARRITWGKFTNAGQTCVAPDYLLVHESCKTALIKSIQHTLFEFYGNDAQQSPNYGRIIHKKRFDTLTSYLSQGRIILGGNSSPEEKYIEPTLMEDVSPEASLMQEEIFGPILPIYTFKVLEEAYEIIQHHPNPLAAYIFTNDKNTEQQFLERLSFGGGCINNTLVHLANPNLPFGGVGNSGMGSYHGKYGFDTFTRTKSVVKTANWIDPSVKYPPFTKNKLRIFRWLMK